MAEYYFGYTMDNPEAGSEQRLEELLRERFGNVSRVYGKPSFRITSDIENRDDMESELGRLLGNWEGLIFQVCHNDNSGGRRLVDAWAMGKNVMDRMDRL